MADAEIDVTNKRPNVRRVIFLRQLFVSSGVWVFAFMFGLSFGLPTVAVPQLRSEANRTSAIDIHLESWLSSGTVFSGIPWVLVLYILVYVIGRKKTLIIMSVTSLLGYVISYIGASVTYTRKEKMS